MHIILVLGQISLPDGELDTGFLTAIKRGVHLLERCVASRRDARLVISGGITRPNEPSEAKAAKAQVPAQWHPYVLLEERAMSTQQNIQYVQELLDKENVEVDAMTVISTSGHKWQTRWLFGRFWPALMKTGRFSYDAAVADSRLKYAIRLIIFALNWVDQGENIFLPLKRRMLVASGHKRERQKERAKELVPMVRRNTVRPGTVSHLWDKLMKEDREVLVEIILKQLAPRAYLDQLTSLANRHALAEESEERRKLPKKEMTGVAVLILDCDGFKQINDQFGHDDGDEVLRQIAGILSLRSTDTIVAYRRGGDEFEVLMDESTPSAMEAAAARILHEAQAKGYKLSIGMAFTQNPEEDLPTLTTRADVALYVAKAAGGNQIR